MSKDFGWEENNQVFDLDGKRWGIIERLNPKTGLRDLVNVMLPKDEPLESLSSGIDAPESKSQPVLQPAEVLSTTPDKNVTDKCQICGNPITFKRADTRFCSTRCKQKNYRDNRKGQLVLIK